MKRLGLLLVLLTMAVFLFVGASTNHHTRSEQETRARWREVEMARVEMALDKMAAQAQQFAVQLNELKAMTDSAKGNANARRRK
jgi:hypothetical protein